jgi:hypothetical protein
VHTCLSDMVPSLATCYRGMHMVCALRCCTASIAAPALNGAGVGFLCNLQCFSQRALLPPQRQEDSSDVQLCSVVMPNCLASLFFFV